MENTSASNRGNKEKACLTDTPIVKTALTESAENHRARVRVSRVDEVSAKKEEEDDEIEAVFLSATPPVSDTPPPFPIGGRRPERAATGNAPLAGHGYDVPSAGDDRIEECDEECEAISAFVVREREVSLAHKSAAAAAITKAAAAGRDCASSRIVASAGPTTKTVYGGARLCQAMRGKSQDEEDAGVAEGSDSSFSKKKESKLRLRRRRWRCVGAAIVCAIVVAVLVTLVATTMTRRMDRTSSIEEENIVIVDTRPVIYLTPVTKVISSAAPSASPPSSERFTTVRSTVRSILSSHGMTTAAEARLDDSSSPQGRALEWLVNEDGRWVDLDRDKLGVAQRFALATFYFSTGGPDSWIEDCNFLSSEHECQWNQHGTNASFIRNAYVTIIGILCAEDNVTVNSLMIVKNNMTGTIPEELGIFNHLIHIDLAGNHLYGPIPRTVLNIPHLKRLILSDNALAGPIPDYTGGASELEVLFLHANSINSTIPSSLGSIQGLNTILLGFNYLTGSVPSELMLLQGLEHLVLDVNSLTSINFLRGDMPNLKTLSVKSNLLESIPPTVFGFENLTTLHLFDNSISGSLPSALTQLGRLESLDFGSNLLNGTIPAGLFGLGNLQQLILGPNSFSGTLHSSVGNLTYLNYLDLGNNVLFGTIPSAIGKLSSLKSLALHRNTFTGTVPRSVSTLPLGTLLLHGNNINDNMDFLCESTRTLGLFLVADCFGESQEVNCSCCSACCSDDRNDGPVFGCFPET